MRSLLEQINTLASTWYAAMDLANAFFLVPAYNDHQKQAAFSWQGHQYTSTIFPQGYINFPALYHNLVKRDLNHLSVLQYITLVNCIDDTMLVKPNEQKAATTLDLLIMHMHIRGWKINSTEIQGPSPLVKLLGAPWCGACRDIPSKVKAKLLHLTLSTPRKKHI